LISLGQPGMMSRHDSEVEMSDPFTLDLLFLWDKNDPIAYLEAWSYITLRNVASGLQREWRKNSADKPLCHLCGNWKLRLTVTDCSESLNRYARLHESAMGN
jgi:hypothetical protein